jgi:hypothetical protein
MKNFDLCPFSMSLTCGDILISSCQYQNHSLFRQAGLFWFLNRSKFDLLLVPSRFLRREIKWPELLIFESLTFSQLLLVKWKVIEFLDNVKLKLKYFKSDSDNNLNLDRFEIARNFDQELRDCHFFIQQQTIQFSPFTNAK